MFPVGTFTENPDGGYFFVDPHEGGAASGLRLVEVSWGRIVDVHGLDEEGAPTAEPILRDYVIRENLVSDGSDYLVETDPVTSATRLVIRRRLEAGASSEPGSFQDLLRRASDGLVPVLARGDGPGTPGPFSYLPRNATLVLRFDDLLEDVDGGDAIDLVRVLVGDPPTVPYEARVRFDSNHGGLAGGAFHATRVLVDMTVSSIELEPGGRVLEENAVGLPASREGLAGPSVSLRIPTRTGQGQFYVLRNLAGEPLDVSANGPVDLAGPTFDVVRALRAGNAGDVSNGFLRDETPPFLLADWPVVIDAVVPALSGTGGRDFVLGLSFQGPCLRALRTGDLLRVGERHLEVLAASEDPSPLGRVEGVRARLLDRGPTAPQALFGRGFLSTPYDGTGDVPPACFVETMPSSPSVAGEAVDPGATIRLWFSEPMDPSTLVGFHGMSVVDGDASQAATATTRVIGDVSYSPDARRFAFQPRLPLDHVQGVQEVFTVRTGVTGASRRVTDLAGNELRSLLPPVEITLDASAPTSRTGGIALDFLEPNEYDREDPSPGGNADLRGQVSYDLARGVLRPRPVSRTSVTVDSDAGLPSLMFPLPLGFPAPLSPRGSKLQTLWRYADFGWRVADESKYDLDVEGLAWKPFTGQVTTEFYEGFEISLAHSSRLPDETLLAPFTLRYPSSGLLDSPQPFRANVLEDPASPQKVVHGRSLGYVIDPSDLFRAANGSNMMPFPLNRSHGPHETFTWRDTSVLATGGASGGGIPLGIESMIGETTPAGSIAGPGAVPSFGLPLLLELSCFPSNSGIGVNDFTLAIASFGQLMPNFRVHSTGGIDTSGQPQEVNPDLEPVPNGGFDPTSSPPGMPTRSADPTVYFGQLDLVTRVSRAHTVWFDAQSASPDWVEPRLLPASDEQPEGTAITLHFRGARGFAATQGTELDASSLNAYGDLTTGSVDFVLPGGVWTDSIDDLDGARYLQVRITFENNVLTGKSPYLDALSLSYRR